ncbi:MAG TPA: hypothetical protein PLM55_06400 [Chitinophagales bacterium]|nr:hypothetical protein [Chitinophagales bacterium]
MIDGVKISFHSKNIMEDLQKLQLPVITPVEEETGETHYPKKVEYRNLCIEIFASGRVQISGSLHKYCKGENHSDFTFQELRNCITELCLKLNVEPSQVNIHNIEFGVNVHTNFNPFEFCRNVIAYKNNSFAKFRTNGKDKIDIGFIASQQQYAVKVYDKGKQYRKHLNCLRFEVRVEKMRFLENAGLRTLSDLCKPKVQIQLGTILDEVFAELIIRESVNISNLTSREQRIYLQCTNPKEWERFSAKKRCKRKKQFNDIQNRYATTRHKETVTILIKEKWECLSKNGYDLTKLSEPHNTNEFTKNGYDLTDPKNEKRECFNRLDNALNHSHPERRCKTCGRDISNQKIGSVFCSEKMFGAQAKKCRNADSNPRKVVRYREHRLYRGLTLFERKTLVEMQMKGI